MASIPHYVSSPPIVATSKPAQTRRERKAANKAFAGSGNHFSINDMSVQASSSSNKIKVFEDGSKGIVCYRDERGEITCEGYDEGPRFCQQLSGFSCNPRAPEIIDLLQRCWLRPIEGNDEM